MNRCTVCRELVSGSASADHQRMHSQAVNNWRAKRSAKMIRRRGYKVMDSGNKISVQTGRVIAEPGFFSRIWQWLKSCFSQNEVVNAG